MNSRNLLTKTDSKKNLLDMINIRNLTTKNILKQSELIKKYQSKESKKLSLNSLKSLINNPNLMNLNNNNLTEIHLLKYRPKRAIKLKEQGRPQIPFSRIGGLSLDFEKTYSFDDKKNKMKINDNQNLISQDNEKLMISNNDTEFKSIYFFKFAKNSEEFDKISKNADLMGDNEDKRIFEESFLKLSKLIESQNKLLFNNLDITNNNKNNKNINSNNITVVNNFEFSPIKINSFNSNTKNHFRNQLIDGMNNFTYTSNLSPINNPNNSSMISNSFSSQNYIVNIKKLITYWSDFIAILNKFLSQIFNKYFTFKKEYEKMKKKSYRDELKLNNKLKEVDELNKYLKRFDVNMKINHQIQKENEIKELNKTFKKKENEYIILIYKLEEEIRDLTTLLDKNKNYYDEYKNISKEIDKNKRQSEMLKNKFNRELQETNVKILIEKDIQDELQRKIEDLKKEIKELKKEKEISKKTNIELQAKIKKLEMIIGEKKENIAMLNEEMEWYMRKFQEVQFNNDIIKNEFNILERKLLNLEEEKQKAILNKKKENIINRNLDSLSPKQYKNEDNYGSSSPITNFTQGNNN